MDDPYYQFISETLGTYPVNINSELVSFHNLGKEVIGQISVLKVLIYLAIDIQ